MAAVEKFDIWLERERAEAREQGLEKGRLELVLRLFERKLARPLTSEERADLIERANRLGADRLSDVVLDLDATALATWLANPTAR